MSDLIPTAELRQRIEVLTERRQEAYNNFLLYSGGIQILEALIAEAEPKKKEPKE